MTRKERPNRNTILHLQDTPLVLYHWGLTKGRQAMKRNYTRVIDEMQTTHGMNLVTIGQRIGINPRTVGKWAQGKHKPNKKSRKRLNQLYREVKQVLKDIRKQGYYMEGELVEEPQTTIKAPSTLAEAERYYIDTLAKAIAEAQNMDEKSRLTSKLTRFMQEVEPQWN